MQTLNIGIDAGGVMFVHVERKKNNEDTSTTNWMVDALSSMQKLKNMGHRLFLVSFAGKKTGEETKRVIKLDASGFINNEDMFIVNDRKKKGIVCKQQKIDIMIDDRADVLLSVMKDSPSTLCFLFGDCPCDNSSVVRVSSWNEFLDYFNPNKIV